jgi:hypothetical protein
MRDTENKKVELGEKETRSKVDVSHRYVCGEVHAEPVRMDKGVR